MPIRAKATRGYALFAKGGRPLKASRIPLGGLSANRDQRYCPVFATVSIDRPASVPVLPETRVLM